MTKPNIRPTGEGPGPRALRSVESVSPARDPLDWLRATEAFPKVLFYDLADGSFLAGAGAADLLRVEDPTEARAIEALLHERRQGADPTLPGWVGGVRFAPHRQASREWAPFGAAWWMLPRDYLRSDGKTSFEGRIVGAREEFAAPSVPSDSAPGEAVGDYHGRVASAVESIRGGEFEKVVLARTVKRAGRPDVAATLGKLIELETTGYAFWLALSPEYGFFGVTPETLYRRDGVRLRADALAGTMRRGVGEDEDRALGEALVADPKSRNEHAFVKNAIVQALDPLASRVVAPGNPELRTLARVHHLFTPVEAQLLRPEPVLDRLHPTPAVCGTPTRAAEEAIARLEAVDRGLYSGAVGWWRADGESVGVALRCAQYARRSTTTFLGAGIVEDSRPESEARELDEKARALFECWTDQGGPA